VKYQSQSTKNPVILHKKSKSFQTHQNQLSSQNNYTKQTDLFKEKGENVQKNKKSRKKPTKSI
jgi:hypothetical protein